MTAVVTFTDADILAAAWKASGRGTRVFSLNDVYSHLGFISGKGPRWEHRHAALPGVRISRVMVENGYVILSEYANRSNTRRYCLAAGETPAAAAEGLV